MQHYYNDIDILPNFFDKQPFSNHPYQLNNLNGVSKLPSNYYLISWKVSESEFNNYYKDRYIFDLNFIKLQEK